ncbi:hypothetical protein [Phaeobacter sp.]|uniref:hypothetical protein n=1 Tax=Phaeobacter sp. TaxID=1902409 RepID=UPI002600593F|nr:hypothetical protein [Phaeobacter sp.]
MNLSPEQTTDAGETAATVRRRKLFYVPGFDPFHPRRYRELYRKESAIQAEISGYQIALTAQAPEKTGSDPSTYGWHLRAMIEDQSIETDVEVLIWSDIVKENMTGGITRTYLQLLRTAWLYARTGTFQRLMWLRKGPVIAALYPVVVLLLQACAALVCVVALHALFDVALLSGLGLALGEAPGPSSLLAVASSAVAWAVDAWFGWKLLQVFKALDRHVYAHYLMHDFAFAASQNGAYPAALERRIAEFSGEIAAALSEPTYDEVLVVGHSSGAYIAVSAVADVMRILPLGRQSALGLLTLGQVVPMVSFLPDAYRLRRDLQDLSHRSDLCWVDVSAPGDGCCFALCDPVAVSGVAGTGTRWPLVVSAAFSQTLSPAKQAALRWRFFRLHFQYLCAFDQPGDYDFFQITAGPMTLEARYRDRAPSRSRIDVTASKFTAVDR